MKFIWFMSMCFIAQQVCGNQLVAINQNTKEIYACNTVTLECDQISWLTLMLIRNTNSCDRLRLVDEFSGKYCQ